MTEEIKPVEPAVENKTTVEIVKKPKAVIRKLKMNNQVKELVRKCSMIDMEEGIELEIVSLIDPLTEDLTYSLRIYKKQ